MTTLNVLFGVHLTTRELGYRCVSTNGASSCLEELNDGGNISAWARLPPPLRICAEAASE